MDIITYGIIGGVGVVIALLGLIFDEILEGIFEGFEISFLPDGFLSGTSVAATIAGFGLSGVAAISFGVESDTTVFLIAVGFALLCWIGSGFLYMSLKNRGTEDGADSPSNYLGLIGNVTTPPRNKDSWGEMNLNTRGYTKRIYMRTEDKVSIGDSVKITSVLGSSRVAVTKVVENDEQTN